MTTTPNPLGGILNGVRILDFTWWIAGPLGPRMLTPYGAEVIHIEPPHNPDHHRFDHRRAKGPGVADMVVAGAHQHHRVGRQAPGGERDSSGGVLRLGLDDDRGARRFAMLRFDMFEMLRAGDHDGRRETFASGTAPQCRFEQRALANQRQERLGPARPAARPQPRAAAAAQDDRHDGLEMRLRAHGEAD